MNTQTKLGEAYISICKLPDGRWAVRNERNTSDLTREDLTGMVEAFKLWGALLWERR